MALFDFLRTHHKTGKPSGGLENKDADSQKYKISGTGRNYDDLDNYDVALKIWLPEAIEIGLREMCNFANTTKSDLIRQTLFTYLYGRYDLNALIERGDRSFALSHPVFYQRAEEPDITATHNRTPELGKNTEDVKVWIAVRMKQDLQNLADHAGITLSHFVREILISNLFGHTFLSERLPAEEFNIEFEHKESS